MTLYRSMGAALETAGNGTNPLDVRKDLESIFVRPGVLPGAPTLVLGQPTWQYMVAAASWVTQSASGDGLHLWGNDGNIWVDTDPAPSAGLSRIDIVWVRHPSNGENGDSTSEPTVGVAKGTAAASPAAPALPAGAFELARNTMTSAATSTASAGNTITQTAPYTALKGAAVPCRSQAELVALAPYAMGDVPALGSWATRLYKVASGGTVLPDTGNGTAFPFSANWGNHPSFAASVSYKDWDGFVRLTGVAYRTGATVSAATATLGTLPAGHHPAAAVALPCSLVSTGGAAIRAGILQVSAGGVVTLNLEAAADLVQNTSYVTLSGSFRAA